MTWTPTSQFAPAAEPSVWQRIAAEYRRPFSEVKAPEGYRFKMLPNGEPEFRVPSHSCDRYMCSGEDCPGHIGNEYATLPRLILEPIAPTPKRYTITLEETGEVREARNDDWFRFDGGAIDVWHDAEPSVNECPILRVVSREAL